MSGLSCYGCGLADAQSICTITSPSYHLLFDYTTKSIEATRGFIAKSEAQVATLDAAIGRLQHHRDRLHRATLRHQNYLPRISRLPDDILLLVFQEAIEHRTLTARPKPDIWDLAAVCSRWRSLALSSPSLWAKLIVDLMDPSDDALALDERSALLCCQRALLQLQRSGKHPLLCYIGLPDDLDDHTYNHPFISSTIRHIVSHLHRCTTLRMIGRDPPSWDIFPPIPPTFNVLRSLEYANTWKYIRGRPETRMPLFFEAAPSLERLDIGFVRLSIPFPTSWKTLTDLNISACYVNSVELVDLLCFTEHLEKLGLHLLISPNMFNHQLLDALDNGTSSHLPSPDPLLPPTKNLLLPHLDKIFLAFGWPPDLDHDLLFHRKVIRDVLPHLRCPNISTVRLVATGTDPIAGADLFGPATGLENDIQAVQRFILDSNAAGSVRSIILMDLEDEDIAESIITLLTKLPALQSLAIEGNEGHHMDFGGSILAALQWPAQVPDNAEGEDREDQIQSHQSLQLCPQLRHLEIGRWRLDSRLFQELVLSRLDDPGVQRLLSISVDYLEFTDEIPASGEHLGWLKEALRNGLLESVQIYQT